MPGTERITIRLPTAKIETLQSLVDQGLYSNISDAIRQAIDDMLYDRDSPENIRKVTVELPSTKVIELESLVKDGDSVSLDDAIRNAVREYTRVRVQMPLPETE